MRYEFIINSQTMRGELDAETVARFTADGIPLAIARRRHYRRGTEPHVGEYTAAEHAAMLADGWELIEVLADGQDVVPDPVVVTPPIPATILDISAEILDLWAQTRLPVPADFDEAIALLESSQDPAILRLALKLLARRTQLIEAGGTWSQVLALAPDP